MASSIKTALLLVCPLLLAACGDDLESRNEAVMASRGGEGQQIVLQRRGGGGTFGREPSAQPTTGGSFAEESAPAAKAQENAGPPVHDAAPGDLVDTTEGFEPVPIDDGEGMADDWGA